MPRGSPCGHVWPNPTVNFRSNIDHVRSTKEKKWHFGLPVEYIYTRNDGKAKTPLFFPHETLMFLERKFC